MENATLHGDSGKNFKKPRAGGPTGGRPSNGGYEAETDFVMGGVPKLGSTFVK